MISNVRVSDYNYTTDGMRFLYHPDEDPNKKRKIRYFSVTSILGRVWPAPFLEEWRNTNLFNALVKNENNILEKIKEASEWEPQNVLNSISKKNEVREIFNDARNDLSAANRGTRIHKTIEMVLRTGDKTYLANHYESNEEEGYIASTVLMWMRENKVEPLYLEIPVWNTSPRMRYTGVVDLVVDGSRFGYPNSWVFVDFKFGKNINPTHGMQLAAYAQANECQLEGVKLPTNSKTHDAKPVHLAFILHNHDGHKIDDIHLYDVKLDEAWHHFSLLYQIFILSMAYPKGIVKGVKLEDLVVNLKGFDKE